MNKKGRNAAASVQAKLLRLSRSSKLSLQDLLERYCTIICSRYGVGLCSFN